MRYVLGMWQPDVGTPEPEVLRAVMADMAKLREKAEAEGAWVTTIGLTPAHTATVVRGGDAPIVTDGPYVEGKEHLGGFVVLDLPDLDAATHWARLYSDAALGLPIEVRAVRF